jgi:hypothetical protein
MRPWVRRRQPYALRPTVPAKAPLRCAPLRSATRLTSYPRPAFGSLTSWMPETLNTFFSYLIDLYTLHGHIRYADTRLLFRYASLPLRSSPFTSTQRHRQWFSLYLR